MKNLIMAWRNLWRNRRRTMITVGSIFFGVLLSTIMSAMQEGIYSNMIDNVVKSLTGYVQIQHPDYEEKKSINNIIEYNPSHIKQIEKLNHVESVVPRLQNFTLISYKTNTKGGVVIGIDPEKEKDLSNIERFIKQGTYLKPNDDGALLTVNIAEYLKLSVGDTLVLLSQGYHGASAAGLYPVKGILEFPNPSLNNLGLYITIKQAQQLFAAPNKITSLCLVADDYTNVPKLKEQLTENFKETYNVLTWRELSPELVQFIESDKASGIIFKSILYIVIAFGIFGTIIMMVSERKRELGVMVAVGMQRKRLSRILFYETNLIGLLGVIAGFLISIPIIGYLQASPIPITGEAAEVYKQYGMEAAIFFQLSPNILISQVITIFIFTLIISIYPYLSIRNLNVINALRS